MSLTSLPSLYKSRDCGVTFVPCRYAHYLHIICSLNLTFRKLRRLWNDVEKMDDIIYLLIAIGLTPGGSSTVPIYTHRRTKLTKIIHRKAQLTRTKKLTIVESGRPHMTLCRMSIACGYIRLQIHTHTCNTVCFFTATVVA